MRPHQSAGTTEGPTELYLMKIVTVLVVIDRASTLSRVGTVHDWVRSDTGCVPQRREHDGLVPLGDYRDCERRGDA